MKQRSPPARELQLQTVINKEASACFPFSSPCSKAQELAHRKSGNTVRGSNYSASNHPRFKPQCLQFWDLRKAVVLGSADLPADLCILYFIFGFRPINSTGFTANWISCTHKPPGPEETKAQYLNLTSPYLSLNHESTSHSS